MVPCWPRACLPCGVLTILAVVPSCTHLPACVLMFAPAQDLRAPLLAAATKHLGVGYWAQALQAIAARLPPAAQAQDPHQPAAAASSGSAGPSGSAWASGAAGDPGLHGLTLEEVVPECGADSLVFLLRRGAAVKVCISEVSEVRMRAHTRVITHV